MGEQKKQKKEEQNGGTERSQFAEKTTGEFAENADKGTLAAVRDRDEKEDFDATSGAGGTGVGGGTSGVPT